MVPVTVITALYPPDQWKEVLLQLSTTYHEDPERVKKYAEKLKAGVAGSEIIHVKKKNQSFQLTQLKGAVEMWEANFDQINGGNKGAPKFPMPASYDFLLAYFDLTMVFFY